MTNLLQRGSDWLQAQRAAFLSSPVVYIRGVTRIAWSATIGRTPFEEVEASGTVHARELRDYIGTAADLAIGGAAITPVVGDRIEQVIGTETVVFEVVAQDGEPCYRYADPNYLSIRVHTQRITND